VLIADPKRAKERSDMALPKLTKSSTEIEDPKREIPLMDKQLPNLT
jgi:hypothetical protein